LNRTLAPFCALAIFLSGCSEREVSPADSTGGLIDADQAMVGYLQQQGLPALKLAQTWNNNYGTGIELQTQHYQVYTTLLDPLMLSQVPGFLESAWRGYNRQLLGAIETKTRFTVYLFADRAQWESFTDEFAGPRAKMYRKIRAGAYYLKGACVAYNIGRERTFCVLGHEGWHQFNYRHFKFRLPSWLDEGIATLFETYRYEHGLFYFEPGRNPARLGDLKKTLASKKMIPLRELISINPGEVLAADSAGGVNAFYCQSYALVRFLREEGYGKRLPDYHKLLLDGLNGAWPLSEQAQSFAGDRNIPLTTAWNRAISPMLFERYIGGDFEQLEQEYVAFCRKIVYRVRFR